MYVVMMIYGLSRLGLWDSSLLKGSLIWFFSVAVFSLFQVNKFSESPHKLKGLVANSFKLVVVIEYLVGVYTFHFAVELVLVPLVVFLSALVAFSEAKPEYESVHKFLSAVLAIVGAAILGSVMCLVVKEFQQIANRQAASEFALPAILSALYTPFIAFMAVYSTYQTVLIRLRCSIKKRHVEVYARFIAMVIFNVRIEPLKRWSASVTKCRLQTIGEVNRSFHQFFQMLAREKSPNSVSLPEGWSPNQARHFLLSEGVETGYYNPIDPMEPSEWFSCSKLVEFGSGFFPNNIAYYLNGNEHAVTSLKLKLPPWLLQQSGCNNHVEDANLPIQSKLYRITSGRRCNESLGQQILDGVRRPPVAPRKNFPGVGCCLLDSKASQVPTDSLASRIFYCRDEMQLQCRLRVKETQ